MSVVALGIVPHPALAGEDEAAVLLAAVVGLPVVPVDVCHGAAVGPDEAALPRHVVQPDPVVVHSARGTQVGCG